MTEDSEQNVTLVTRNESKLRLLGDLAMTAAAFYYITHPDCIDWAKERVSFHWQQLIHKVSIWRTVQSIESLPETDSGE